jgi:hypothetical protein
MCKNLKKSSGAKGLKSLSPAQSTIPFDILCKESGHQTKEGYLLYCCMKWGRSLRLSVCSGCGKYFTWKWCNLSGVFFNSPYVTFSLQSLGWPAYLPAAVYFSTQINVYAGSYTTLRVLLFQQMSRSRAGRFVIIGYCFKSWKLGTRSMVMSLVWFWP